MRSDGRQIGFVNRRIKRVHVAAQAFATSGTRDLTECSPSPLPAESGPSREPAGDLGGHRRELTGGQHTEKVQVARSRRASRAA